MLKIKVTREYSIKCVYDKDLDKFLVIILQDGKFYNQAVSDVNDLHKAVGMDKACRLIEQQMSKYLSTGEEKNLLDLMGEDRSGDMAISLLAPERKQDEKEPK